LNLDFHISFFWVSCEEIFTTKSAKGQGLRAKGDSISDFEFIEPTGKKYSPQRAPRTLSKRLRAKC
jgi:hypothetical protein